MVVKLCESNQIQGEGKVLLVGVGKVLMDEELWVDVDSWLRKRATCSCERRSSSWRAFCSRISNYSWRFFSTALICSTCARKKEEVSFPRICCCSWSNGGLSAEGKTILMFYQGFLASWAKLFSHWSGRIYYIFYISCSRHHYIQNYGFK